MNRGLLTNRGQAMNRGLPLSLGPPQRRELALSPGPLRICGMIHARPRRPGSVDLNGRLRRPRPPRVAGLWRMRIYSPTPKPAFVPACPVLCV